MRILIWLFYLILILLGISFAALNAGTVELNFYIKTMTIPIAILMAMMLGIGLFLGCLFSLCRYWRLKLECNKIKNQLKLSTKEIKNLRDIPLKNQH